MARDPVSAPLEQPVTVLPGVGPERAALLARLEIRTIHDLLRHAPRRHEDRRHLQPIAALRRGEPASVHGTVVALGLKTYRRRSKSVFELIVDDGTARLHCRWWNLPYMEQYFAMGDEVLVFGKPGSLKPRSIDHPETEVIEAGADRSIHMNRLAPIYPLTEGLPQRWLRGLIWRTLAAVAGQIEEPWPQLDLSDEPSRADAFRWLHFPDDPAQAERGRQRLALDEFIELQGALQRRRRRLQTRASALPCAGDNRLIRPFLARLGFRLTGAQTRVLREVRADLRGEREPMRRLLQGDVGSGKTVVAACAALMAIESGYAVALMAPTELLAEQHRQTFTRWFEPLGVPVRLRTGTRDTQPAARPTPWSGGAGDAFIPALTIGTHALIQDAFTVERLGLVIIDEQHRFGVAQREQLVRKGAYPHLLVMTATPIPRTLGLTWYGDLEGSVLDERPAGRGPVRTYVRTADRLPKVWAFVRARLAEGRQAYVVYPRVEDTGDPGLKAVTEAFAARAAELAPFRVGLLHGRLTAEAKEAAMADFRANRVQVLLATSIVEVGVDVPNATVMVIENAEQFGLAQLHQLRGRIGRGPEAAWCILVAAARTLEARRRLKVLEDSQDGFAIAEADLQLRGPGELLGQQQSGVPQFRFGDLRRDGRLIERARALVRSDRGGP